MSSLRIDAIERRQIAEAPEPTRCECGASSPCWPDRDKCWPGFDKP